MAIEHPEFVASCTLYLRRGPDELIDVIAERTQEGVSTLSIARGVTGQPDMEIILTKREAQLLIQHLWNPVILEILDMEVA
jgi:hypothetical protein